MKKLITSKNHISQYFPLELKFRIFLRTVFPDNYHWEFSPLVFPGQPTGACYDFFPLEYSKKPQGRNLKCQIFIQHFFKIVLYWCLDLICHNIGTQLKLNKYIFDILVPFCHHLYLSSTLKQYSQNLQSPKTSSIMFTCQYEVDFLRAI